jgi:hypothetical protein
MLVLQTDDEFVSWSQTITSGHQEYMLTFIEIEENQAVVETGYRRSLL